MADLNQCNFIGRLGADPEIKYLPNGDPVANFSIAVGEKWTDKQTGGAKENTEWVRIVAFRKLAEIIADQMQMLGSKQDRPPPHGDKQPLGDNKGSQNYASAKNGNAPPQNSFEDDIPF